MKEHSDAKYSLNHVTQIHRQAGSAFKPFVYAAVLENGTSPDTLVECGPYSYRLVTGEIWNPQGTGNCENGGKVNLYKGMAASINTVAARLVTNVTTPDKVVYIARRLGINSPLKAVPSIALGGGGEITPFEITSAFGAFAFRGYHIIPNYITKILDKNENVIFENKSSVKLNDVINRVTAIKLTRLMQGVIEGGTGWRVRQFFKNIEAAGKTGTTNDNGDAWFIGYTPELVAGIWVGFDDLRVKLGTFGDGGRAAAPIWGRLMAKIYNDPELQFKEKRFEFNVIDSTDSIYKQTYFSYFNNNKQKENLAGNSELSKIINMQGKKRYKNSYKFPALPGKKEEISGLN
jgi:penicillin-binding protein 1A